MSSWDYVALEPESKSSSLRAKSAGLAALLLLSGYRWLTRSLFTSHQGLHAPAAHLHMPHVSRTVGRPAAHVASPRDLAPPAGPTHQLVMSVPAEPTAPSAHTPFTPRDGVAAVLMEPQTLGPLQIIPIAAGDEVCIFAYGDVAMRISGEAHIMDGVSSLAGKLPEGRIYGARVHLPDKMAIASDQDRHNRLPFVEATGLPGDVVQGVLFCWKESGSEKLLLTDALMGYGQIEPAGPGRSQVSVITHDGSVTRAFCYTHIDSSDNKETRLDPFISRMCQSTGFEEDEVKKMLQKFPSLVSLSMDSMTYKMEEIARMLDCSPSEVRKMVASFPSLLGLNIDSVRTKLSDVQSMTGATDKQVCRMVLGFPSMLGLNTDSMRLKLKEICDMCGCESREAGKMVVGYPQLLGLNADSMRTKITDIARMVGTSEAKVGRMVVGWPQLMDLNVLSMEEKMKEIGKMTGSSKEKVGKMIQNFPQLLGYNAVSMRLKIAEIAAMTDSSKKEVGKMVAGWPSLLGLNADSMRDKIAAVAEMTGSSRSKVGKMVAGFPQLLGYNTESMRGKMDEIVRMIGEPKAKVGKMVIGWPQILGLNPETIQRKIKDISEITGGTQKEIGKMVAGYPQLLGYNVSTMPQKLAEIADMIGSTYEEVGQMAIGCPQLLCLNENTISEKIEELTSILQTDSTEIGVFIKSYPCVMGTPVDNVRTRAVRLAELIIKHGPLSKEPDSPARRKEAEKQATALITQFPLLLSLNFERNLEPTLTFLLKKTAIGWPQIVANVRLLSFSLSKRILPRYWFALLFSMELTPNMIQASPDHFFVSTIRKADPTVVDAHYTEFKRIYMEALAANQADFDEKAAWAAWHKIKENEQTLLAKDADS